MNPDVAGVVRTLRELHDTEPPRRWRLDALEVRYGADLVAYLVQGGLLCVDAQGCAELTRAAHVMLDLEDRDHAMPGVAGSESTMAIMGRALRSFLAQDED